MRCSPECSQYHELYFKWRLDLDVDSSKVVRPNRYRLHHKAHDFHEQLATSDTPDPLSEPLMISRQEHHCLQCLLRDNDVIDDRDTGLVGLQDANDLNGNESNVPKWSKPLESHCILSSWTRLRQTDSSACC